MRRQDMQVGKGQQQGIDWSEDLREGMRDAARAFVEDLLEEALADAIGAERYERGQARAGYRNGSMRRTLTTAGGTFELAVPRGRLAVKGGGTKEWRSGIVGRYARRTRDVDESMLSMYLAGVNTRKVKAVMRPLVGGTAMSKSAVSRIVSKVESRFDAWSKRSLAEEDVVFLYLDGIALKVRLAGRVQSVPVLCALGVRSDGSKLLLAIEMAGSESLAAWEGFLRAMEARGLSTPHLCVIDGNPGLRGAVTAVWPKADVQRCTVHKLRNLLAKAPPRLHDEIRTEYRAFVDAKTAKAAREGYDAFLAKWTKRCPGMAKSLLEAGDELLTYTTFPRAQWKCLRTTNVIERLNEEFRRRVKTQSSLPNERAAVVLLFSLLDQGLVRLRKIDGWKRIAKVLLARARKAA